VYSRTYMNLRGLFKQETTRRTALVQGHVVPDTARCVQCGICSYNCPINIDVRRHAWLGIPVKQSHCLTCGECVNRCPRGVLRFERTNIFETGQPNLGGD
jgi:NAD-dependent dihydropyrimidine dehydrogenase PreA subunit